MQQSPAAEGRPYPLGATFDGEGVNFAVYSRHGTRAYVCVFDPVDHKRELARYELVGREAHVFFGYVPRLAPGALYGFRIDGPYEPARGHRFNAHKLLLDPYARAIVGELDWAGPIEGYRRHGHGHGHGHGDDSVPDDRDSAPFVPKAAVIDDAFDWGSDRPPAVPWRDTVIYEAHVAGLTRLHPDVPPALRGTFAGVAHPAVIEHLVRLGVTAVELLPIHHHLDEEHLARRGMRNYWGYSTIGFFAPDRRFAAGAAFDAPVRECKQMVKDLHAAGIEVILDVVYNHTAEGGHLGPTLAFRGLDHAVYYHLEPHDPRRCRDFTGTGNSLDAGALYPMQLVLDSLRHWAGEVHVDGFRFDLATELGRTGPDKQFQPWAAFFQAVHQDPVLARCKLIAEPWDVGHDGYRLGQFPCRFAEWNDRFRETSRRYWKGDLGVGAELRARLVGSADVFRASGRRPHAAINYVTCHDGFTLDDLVSYERKHNEQNGEDNRDGAHENHSVNHGVEGPTTDPAVRAARERHKRNLLATLLLARGVPMLLAGDERSRTQQGNNNAYCQDNEISWLDWRTDEAAAGFERFVGALLGARAALSDLLEDAWPEDPASASGATFLRPSGEPFGGPDPESDRCFGLYVVKRGKDVRVAAPTTTPVALDATTQGWLRRARALLAVWNGGAHGASFRLPPPGEGERWMRVLDTAQASGGLATPVALEGTAPVAGHSVVLCVLGPKDDERARDVSLRAALAEARVALGHVHRLMIELGRPPDAPAVGVGLLHALVNDPAFRWLHPVAELLVDLDVRLESELPVDDTEAAAIARELEAIVVPSAPSDPQSFGARYVALLPSEPGLAIAHGRLRQALLALRSAETPTASDAEALHAQHRWAMLRRHRKHEVP